MSANVMSARGGQFATSRRGALDEFELKFIYAKAEAGIPDAAIARMLGRNVDTVVAARENLGVKRVMRKLSAGTRDAEPEQRGIPDVAREIIRDVCRRHNVNYDAMLSPARARRIAWPRQEAFWRLDAAGKWSTTKIGQFFGRDHTTVIHGVRAYQARRSDKAAEDLAAWRSLGSPQRQTRCGQLVQSIPLGDEQPPETVETQRA